MGGLAMAAVVGLGGAIGSLARFWFNLAVVSVVGPRYPWGTLLINILGAFVIGWFSSLTAERLPVSPELRAFVLVGLCGGFTTFSSYSLQTLDLLRGGETGVALAYMAGSALLCLASVWAGVLVGR